MLTSLVVAIALTAAACVPSSDRGVVLSQAQPAPETSVMVGRLDALLQEAIDRQRLDYMADLRLEFFNSIPLPDDPRGRMRLLERRADAALNAGKTDEALLVLGEAEVLAQQLNDQQAKRRIADSTAIGHLRQGEQDNCLVGSEGVCILPLAGHGIHAEQKGAQAALPRFLALAADQSDLSSRWLANLAAMALGEWPEAVPEALQLPTTTFEDASGWPRFVNVAHAAGVDELGVAGGVVLDDFDNDGQLDLVTSTWGLRGRLRFYRNCSQGAVRFCDVTASSGVVDLSGGLNLLQADYDNDGDLDLYVLRGAWLGVDGRIPNSLLRNDGDWLFTDVTETVGLLDYLPTQTAAWADYDLDGHLDLFVGSELSGGSERSRLYRGSSTGNFVRVEELVGLVSSGFVKGSVWGDANTDGWPDLYVSRLGQPNQLWISTMEDGVVRFVEAAGRLGVAGPRRSFAAGFADVNGDGADDILALPFSATDFRTAGLGPIVAHSLQQAHNGAVARTALSVENAGGLQATFEQGRLGDLDRPMLAMAANLGDLNGDGLLDLYVGTGAPSMGALVPNRLFAGREGGGWQEASFSAGLAHLQKGHGIAFGDVDDDGDRDVYAVMGGAYSGDVARNVLFENPGFGHSWIKLRLAGTTANRAAIGARVQVTWQETSATGDLVPRSLTRVVNSGMSFGASTLALEIGVGSATTVERIDVHWPVLESAESRQNFTDVEVNKSYRLQQGSDLVALGKEPMQNQR